VLAVRFAATAQTPGGVTVAKVIFAIVYFGLLAAATAYVTAAVPAALAGGAYAYVLGRWSSLFGSKLRRVSMAVAVALVVCAAWVLTVGHLRVAEYLLGMLWPVLGCGAFAAAVLAYLYPRGPGATAAR
jgi:hypothetical protein